MTSKSPTFCLFSCREIWCKFSATHLYHLESHRATKSFCYTEWNVSAALRHQASSPQRHHQFAHQNTHPLYFYCLDFRLCLLCHYIDTVLKFPEKKCQFTDLLLNPPHFATNRPLEQNKQTQNEHKSAHIHNEQESHTQINIIKKFFKVRSVRWRIVFWHSSNQNI